MKFKVAQHRSALELLFLPFWRNFTAIWVISGGLNIYIWGKAIPICRVLLHSQIMILDCSWQTTKVNICGQLWVHGIMTLTLTCSANCSLFRSSVMSVCQSILRHFQTKQIAIHLYTGSQAGCRESFGFQRFTTTEHLS